VNFYDEAIEAKHGLQQELINKQRTLKELARTKAIEEIETRDLSLASLYAYDISSLEDADPYFWEPRISQLVVATGQQLPDTAVYDPSWLNGKAGYWWFGRSSPLVGISRDNERKYVNALLWKLNPNGSVSIQTFYLEGRSHHSLGAISWSEGDSLSDAMRGVEESEVTITHTPDLVIRDTALRLAQKVTALSHEIVELTENAREKHLEVDRLAGKLEEAGEERPESNYSLSKYDAELELNKQREEVERERAERFGTEYRERLAEWCAASKNALVTFACGCLWLRQKIVITELAQLDRAALRRLAKAEISTRCQVVYLRKPQYAPSAMSIGGSSVDWAYQWAVRGHWRDQPTKEGYKLIWIHPYIKGPEDKPLKSDAARVFAVTR
jgi:hypothetical protein